jgi:hypothetical protein
MTRTNPLKRGIAIITIRILAREDDVYVEE